MTIYLKIDHPRLTTEHEARQFVNQLLEHIFQQDNKDGVRSVLYTLKPTPRDKRGLS